MTLKVGIIGLGQVGASIGLALAGKQPPIQRIGHDREINLARQAEKRGAVDKVSFSLPNTVSEADFVILALPLDQVRPTLEIIAQDLRENCVVFDTSPVKSGVLAAAQELLPPNRHFIGLTPVEGGQYLFSEVTGLEGAKADLFKNGLIGIVSLPGIPAAALNLATDLTAALGAEHMFVDALEVDSFMAALHILPQLAASALVQATMRQPGWQDGRKLTGRPYAEQARSVGRQDTPAAIAAAALQSREHTLRVLDNLIQALYDMRNAVMDQNEPELVAKLQDSYSAYIEWLGDRLQGQWSARELENKTETPTAGDMFGRMFGIRPKDRSKDSSSKRSK